MSSISDVQKILKSAGNFDLEFEKLVFHKPKITQLPCRLYTLGGNGGIVESANAGMFNSN